MLQSREITRWLLQLVDPFLVIDPKVRKRIEQADLQTVRFSLFLQAAIWPLIYVVHYYTNDQLKHPLALYFSYRFGMASAIVAIGLLGTFFKNNDLIIRLLLVMLASLLCAVQSWSMTLGPYISHSYLIWLPLIVLASFARSFILPATWLVCLIFLTKHFWGPHTESRFIVSDTMIGLFILLGVHLVRRVWIDSRALKFLNDDLQRDAFIRQQSFDRQIRSFISPVLINQIERMIMGGATFIAAVDSVLKLRRSRVAVLFSDIRNFSVRSDDLDFIEQELIPSARSILDEAEQNSGVAKQIGDAVLIYYSLDDPEEALLRAVKDGLRCSIHEHLRVLQLKRFQPERFFTVTYGTAHVGNMASAKHREATIIGSPANLAARIDSLTKEPEFREKMGKLPGVLLESAAAETLLSFANGWSLTCILLKQLKLEIRSYPDQTTIFFLAANKINIDLMNKLLTINEISEIGISGGING